MIANSKSNLKRHIKSSLSKHGTSVHERIKYDCEQCAHKASQKSHLFVTKVYMVPTGELPYVCEVCGKGHSSNNTL